MCIVVVIIIECSRLRGSRGIVMDVVAAVWKGRGSCARGIIEGGVFDVGIGGIVGMMFGIHRLGGVGGCSGCVGRLSSGRWWWRGVDGSSGMLKRGLLRWRSHREGIVGCGRSGSRTRTFGSRARRNGGRWGWVGLEGRNVGQCW